MGCINLSDFNHVIDELIGHAW